MIKENEVATTVVDVAYHIHRQLGPGLLESVYHAIMKYELEKRGLRVMSKEPVPIIWEDVELPLAFEADLIVERKGLPSDAGRRLQSRGGQETGGSHAKPRSRKEKKRKERISSIALFQGNRN